MTSTNTAIVNARRLAFGPKDRLMDMSKVKYPWAVEIHERMLANFWTEKGVPMGKDKLDYRSGVLSEREKRAYDYSLAFVSNLDGIQFHNLVDNIGQFVTAPEVSGAIARQAAEEYLHVRAYQTMIEAVSLDPAGVYMLFERDGMLAAKNDFIMSSSDALREEGTPAAFARAIVSNVLLEGLYFYSAFLVFYVLARNGKMLASADMIKYINRDEGETHLDLFGHMHETNMRERPEDYDAQFFADARKLIIDAAEFEMRWGRYIIDGGFLGLTDETSDGHIKTRANACCAKLGMEPVYPGVVNPVPWFDQFSQPGGRKNFFERKPSEYQAGGLDW